MATIQIQRQETVQKSVPILANPSIPVKMLKLVTDPCFGQKYLQQEICLSCWVKQSCFITFRNRK